MSNNHPLPMKGGYEYDAFTKWRRYLCVFDNHHARAKDMKRRYNKRVRRWAKHEIINGWRDVNGL